MSYPGPLFMLRHAAGIQLQFEQIPDYVYYELLWQALNPGESDDEVTRENLAESRRDWNLISAQYTPQWRAEVERDMSMAQSILDDPTHRLFFRGMSKRLQLACAMINLVNLVYHPVPLPAVLHSLATAPSEKYPPNEDSPGQILRHLGAAKQL